MTLNRRNFVKLASAASMLGMSSETVFSNKLLNINERNNNKEVHFTGDGLHLTPLDYSRLLVQLAEEGKIKPDSYSLKGSIEELEIKFAKLLGKESAIFMPTGTLANQIAIRSLADGASKVIVQDVSHIYNDSGDCLQTLSNLNLIPLAAGKATFTLDEVERVVRRAASGRVATRVGVISIESPVRRRGGEMFVYDEMKKISEYARKNNIKLHLDGARIFLASAYTGISPSEYASHFDTVYVSLYKYFNSASGAILAGAKEIIKDLFHVRRVFGSGLPQAWLFAAVASFYADGFLERFKETVNISEELFKALEARPEFKVERIPLGTNIVSISVKLNETDANAYKKRLEDKGVLLLEPYDKNYFNLVVNESLRRMKSAELTDIFIQSLK